MKANITIGEKYRPAMAIKDPQKARKYFDELVANNMACSEHTKEEAEAIEKANLGYFAGYYDNETRVRVEKLFCCAHPVFGKAEKKAITPEEAFAMGVAMGSGTTVVTDEKPCKKGSRP